MSEKRCSVCGEPLDLDKGKTYLVELTNFLTKEIMYSDAIDCEKCGCQNILKERRQRAKDGRKES